MLDLPAIDYKITAQKLAADYGTLKYQYAQLENLAESLRSQRDDLSNQLQRYIDSDEHSTQDEG